MNTIPHIVNTYKTDIVWHNWSLIARDDAVDHHVTHSLHYGWGVFEGIRFYNTAQGPKIFRLDKHIERLFYSAWVMGMTIPYTFEELMQACIDTVAKSNASNGYIRPIVYFWQGAMWVYPDPAKLSVETFISVWKRGKYLSDDPIKVKIAKTRRIHPATSDMKAKIAWHYANSILVSLEIKKAGFDEWLLLDTDGYIAEGPWENIFFAKENKVVTPADGTILPGITRATHIQLLKEHYDIDVIKRKIEPRELIDFDQAFFVGTAAEVTPIWSITTQTGELISYISWNDWTVTMNLKHLYDKVVRGKVETHNDWLF